MENTKWSDESLYTQCQVLCDEFNIDLNKISEKEASKLIKECNKITKDTAFLGPSPTVHVGRIVHGLREICQNKS